MKIIVLSDTHIAYKVPDEILEKIKDADMVVHAGDFHTRAAYDTIKAYSRRLIAVHGNSDDPDLKESLPEIETFEAEGVKIGVVHKGHHVTDLTNMRYLALEIGVEVLVFGHLHRPIIEKSDVLLICPGSPTSPRMADPTMVELTVAGGNVTGRIVKMSGGSVCGYIGFMRSLNNENPDR
ncbi:metallophosphoesterase [Methanocella sp. CWC-04]|uniref:Phosphoesterase n=1 Tax=Methanooceanicella nereidis TaxID=2052831 RepID=A0AAP2RAR4_9EURY|nr:metallophosphoesterase [Methanocella sp. CWC-04]MCD1293709.1 metallophosphoesterase [Methanocella sp. CWC-04]